MHNLFRSALAGTFLSVAAAVPGQAGQEKKHPEIVDMHLVLVVDVSNSMNAQEKRIVMEGYAKALVSPEAKSQFDSGLHYALSLVFYADKTKIMDTQIVRNSQEAASYVASYLWDPVKQAPHAEPPGLGTSTNTDLGLNASAELFRRELEMGFLSLNRSVVISGDDDGPSNYDRDNAVRSKTLMLAEQYGATVFGAPITFEDKSEKILVYAKNSLRTPSGMISMGPDFAQVPVREGNAMPVSSAADMQAIVGQAMRLNMY